MVFLLAFGAEKPPSMPARAETVPTPKSTFAQQWKELVNAAEKEGEVTVYLSNLLRPEKAHRSLKKAFESEFKIKMTPITLGSALEYFERLRAERTAGRYTLDVMNTGVSYSTEVFLPAGAQIPLRPLLIHPEVLDQSAWFQGKLPFLDAEGYNFNYAATPGGSEIAYNTRLVRDPTQLKSFWDIFKPEFKGKIVTRDMGLGAGQTVLGLWVMPGLGPKFLRELHAKAHIAMSARHAVDLLASDQFALCPFCSGSEIRRAQKERLPVAFYDGSMKEGERLSIGGQNLMAWDRPPHPNAAKLFMNWFLTRRGQMVFQDLTKADSTRIDIPKENVDPWDRRKEGRTYLYLEARPDASKLIGEATTFWSKLKKGS
jgi:iron(III) transport system substrate-binding protein